jgi:diguanylate cyclase (GGDEF)-like protein
MDSKYIIVCIDSDIKILNKLEEKITRIIDSNYVVQTYTTAEEALTHSFENIANGHKILMTISNYELANMNAEEFIINLHKNSPYTKNILFELDLTLESVSNIINNASLYRIIEKNLNKYDFELIILDTIKVYDSERRVREYQNILEDAVEKRTKDLKDINVKLHILATTDSLTGIKNRRSFFDSSEPMIPYIRRENQSLAVLAIDIDKFKNINDTYGHSTGDDALVLVSKTISAILRKSDIFGRLGGEEFAVSLPNTSFEGAKMVAEKMRESIENLEFNSRQNDKVAIRISIGVAMLNKDDNNLEDLLQRADEALYKAKDKGRNQVVCDERL